ncbi:MAG: type II toxin-antitoxin system Phd/YefM family antitoxin [Gammaproteobacteria bacterium]|nr:type II toxin-antitoxin system Phd/YefM family antitoxin [Gammaproteobacteria bacterium]MYF58922.1 type II toxin-antitoxin system Phd/YefM family antitoxin [Gammaproteobacteria bacterium]MYH33862.1 type II toxin-antitoxin system Phd/YefM family antitoxin [Gammaproteobacteria bacterium]MYL01408.1 type II toxin-antitoxin system Phd/YefM family antitoxin [Gammaproteobacteria bacterium]
MKTASISDLKANLSRYIREVSRGGEVQVLYRGKPVARLMPPAATADGLRRTLIRSGLLRPGKGKSAAILDEPPIQLPTSLSDTLTEDRIERL